MHKTSVLTWKWQVDLPGIISFIYYNNSLFAAKECPGRVSGIRIDSTYQADRQTSFITTRFGAMNDFETKYVVCI